MLDFKKIVEQAEKFNVMGYGCYGYIDIHLDKEDFAEVISQCAALGNSVNTNSSGFCYFSTAGRIYFYEKEPDYVDGCSYYYFREKQSVYKGLLPTIDTEIRMLKFDNFELKQYDCDGNEKYLFDYVKEAYKKHKDGGDCGIVKESVCYHSQTEIIPLFVSGYKRCCKCGEDLGIVSDDEFRKSLKGKNLRFS